jgi:hypothetical protein
MTSGDRHAARITGFIHLPHRLRKVGKVLQKDVPF